MKNIKNFVCLFSLLLLLSCKDGNNQDIVDIAISSFSVTTQEVDIKCIINNKDNIILIPGVENGSEILGVDYSIPQNATIYPKPDLLINNWDEKEAFILSSSGNVERKYTAVLTDYSEPEPGIIESDAIIYVNQQFGRKTKYFMYDLKGSPGSLSNNERAVKLFWKNGMNGLRVPIYGDNYYKGHPELGVVDREAYATVLKSMTNAMMNYSGDKFMIFASKKNMGTVQFPDWVNNEDGTANPDKYAIMLCDYLKFMKNEGFEVDVLGVDNEFEYNSGKITVDKYNKIVPLVKKYCEENGIKVPQFVAHDRYMPQGDKPEAWLNTAKKKNAFDKIDIYGTHYYPQHHFQVKEGRFEALKYEFDLMNSDRHREFWATEPHWDDAKTEDKLYYSESALCAMFDQTDLGLDAFMWWEYTDADSYKGQIMEAYSLSIFNSTPIRLIDHDGESTFTKGKLQSRAYIKGNEVNIFIINLTPNKEDGKEYLDYKFKLSDEIVNGEGEKLFDNIEIDGDVTLRCWSDETSGDGYIENIEPINSSIFSIDIPIRSVIHLQFRLKQ